MKKKIVSIFLSFVLVICAFTFPVSAKADNYFISGFDVSEHNENIDFSALKAQGYSFVMIRLGYFNRLDNKFTKTYKMRLMQISILVFIITAMLLTATKLILRQTLFYQHYPPCHLKQKRL